MTLSPHRNGPALADAAPTGAELTDYDRAHFGTYLRLLDAAAAGAPLAEVARIVLGIDPAADPDLAHRVHETHLARAGWLTKHGYRALLKGPT